MLRISEIKLPLDYTEEDLKLKAAKFMKVQPEDITSLKVFRRSVDSRKKQNVHFVFTIDVEVNADEKRILKRSDKKKVQESVFYHYVPVENKRTSDFRPVVVGFGPAGMFCALTLAEAGLKPIVLERGHDADTRTKDVQNFWQNRSLNTSSNIQFGEGGAGTFSDGKLTTGIRALKRRRLRWVH